MVAEEIFIGAIMWYRECKCVVEAMSRKEVCISVGGRTLVTDTGKIFPMPIMEELLDEIGYKRHGESFIYRDKLCLDYNAHSREWWLSEARREDCFIEQRVAYIHELQLLTKIITRYL